MWTNMQTRQITWNSNRHKQMKNDDDFVMVAFLLLLHCCQTNIKVAKF